MNEAAQSDSVLPGLEIAPTAPPPPADAPLASPRVKAVNRTQTMMRVVEVEQLIEEDHPARAIWEFVGQLDLQPFYAPIEAVEGVAGRQPWDPRLLVCLWIYAYSRGIGSAREIARRCAYDPAFQWLTGMEQINYHTLSDFRVGHGERLPDLFAQVLGLLSAEGLVSLERVMHDGTKIKACAGADSFRREEKVRAHLAAARQQVQAMGDPQADESERQRGARERAARERQSRLEQALEELGKIRESKSGTPAQEAARVSLTDPPSRIMKQSDGGYAPSYNVQLSTEASHKIIVGAGVSQGASDYGELSGAVERVKENLGQKPQQMVVDGGFTCRENIVNMAVQGVDLIGSLGEGQAQSAGQMKRRGVAEEFYPAAFVYDAAQDSYRCPAGQTLRHAGQEQRPGVVQHQYRAEEKVCAACPFKEQCCPQNASKGRSITRAVEAPEVEAFAQKMQTEEAKGIYRQRGEIAEFPNAWIKAKLGLREFHVRTLAKVKLEVLWACLTYNIQQWIGARWRTGLVGSAA
jgi:transposase